MKFPIVKGPNANKSAKISTTSGSSKSKVYKAGSDGSYNIMTGNNMEPVKLVNSAFTAYQNLPPDVKSVVKQQVSNRMNRFANPSGKGSSGHSSGYALTDSPVPMNIKLDTGVQPNTYVSDQMDAVYGNCSPMHMTCGIVVIPQSAANSLYTCLIDQIFHLQTGAQANVGFALNVSTDFATDKILSAMNSLTYALQIYFYYKSIISYFSDPTNNNRGMVYLRRNLTPQLLEDLTLLERRLLDTPCPPKLLEYLRYLSGTFYSGNAAGAPLIKICPCNPSITGVDLTTPAAALAGLSTTANNLVFTLMRRAIPQWIIKNLYDVPPQPFYDDNFKTIFANLPAASFFNASNNGIPTVANNTTTIQYNSFTEVLDGAAYCLAGLTVTGLTGWQPGLINALGAGTSRATSSRISYYVDSNNANAGFYGSDLDSYLSRSRPETYTLNDAGTALFALHLPGAQICQIVNNNTLRETSINVIEYLFSLETVKKAKEGFVSDKSGRRKGRK